MSAMGTISIPADAKPWPRSAVAAVIALLVAVALTAGLTLAYGGHTTTTTRTVVVPTATTQPSSSQLLDCRAGRPC